ncbi:hypothetical protein NDU88_001636 [Pleurodeles waltl]|uniref:Uncharacterized protein n=1 Tax=Pleurodeles waltl TaxID=8319 RepID=A0AAV7NKR8_PLEWA|nr:hypothetical protein NDU88_001636 [Pleurodeles waltl]
MGQALSASQQTQNRRHQHKKEMGSLWRLHKQFMIVFEVMPSQATVTNHPTNFMSTWELTLLSQEKMFLPGEVERTSLLIPTVGGVEELFINEGNIWLEERELGCLGQMEPTRLTTGCVYYTIPIKTEAGKMMKNKNFIKQDVDIVTFDALAHDKVYSLTINIMWVKHHPFRKDKD